MNVAPRSVEALITTSRLTGPCSSQITTKLNALIKAIQKSDFNQNTSSDFRKAFWINAYNILVISSVIDNYPLFSIHDVPDFFSQKKFIIHGETLSLNDIETAKLKTVDNYPRIDFTLCKALAGGPPLNKTAFRPDNMDALLDEQTVALINDTATIRLRGKYLPDGRFFIRKSG